MGIFNKIKGLFNKKPIHVSKVELMTDMGNGFIAFGGDIYKSDIVRSSIRPFYKSIGKLISKHIRSYNDELKVNPEPYIKFLLEDPNPYMTGQMLQEKLAIQLALNNNAFAYINRDSFGNPVEIYPIQASVVEAIYDNVGNLYIRFHLYNSKVVTFPYSDIIHLRQDLNSNDIFGDSLSDSIMPLMEVISTTDQGLIKAIKNSNVVRWLLKFNQTLRPEDLKKQSKEFVETFLSTESEIMGAAAVDSKVDAQQVEPKDYVPNKAQMEIMKDRVYSLFNTNEKIIQSKYNEDEWTAYYESVIEPIAIQLSKEYTKKIFTRRERSLGNEIIFESSNLAYASMKTKLELDRMVDRGAMTPNEWRKVFNYAPIEGGNKPIRRLDTAIVGGDEESAK